MAKQKNQNFTKVLNKINEYIAERNFYEAYQVYGFINSRYSQSGRHQELADILYDGACTFIKHSEEENACNLIKMLYAALGNTDICVETWTPKLCSLLANINVKNPAHAEIVNGAVSLSGGGSSKGHPHFTQALAEMFWKAKHYSYAWPYFLPTDNTASFVEFLIDFQVTCGHKSEEDLFITRVVLHYLCYKNLDTANKAFHIYTKDHPSIKRTEPPYVFPLLNFVWLLLQACSTRTQSHFMVLCKQYAPSLSRDPQYKEYLSQIGNQVFGISRKIDITEPNSQLFIDSDVD